MKIRIYMYMKLKNWKEDRYFLVDGLDFALEGKEETLRRVGLLDTGKRIRYWRDAEEVRRWIDNGTLVEWTAPDEGLRPNSFRMGYGIR